MSCDRSIVNLTHAWQHTYLQVLNDFFHWLLVWLLRSARDGAQTTIHCCLDESVRRGRSGAYFEDCAEAAASKHANSDLDARRLYELSAELTGTAHLP